MLQQTAIHCCPSTGQPCAYVSCSQPAENKRSGTQPMSGLDSRNVKGFAPRPGVTVVPCAASLPKRLSTARRAGECDADHGEGKRPRRANEAVL